MVLAPLQKAEVAVEAAVDGEVGLAARAEVRSTHGTSESENLRVRVSQSASEIFSPGERLHSLSDKGGGVSRELELLRQERVAQVDTGRALDVVAQVVLVGVVHG